MGGVRACTLTHHLLHAQEERAETSSTEARHGWRARGLIAQRTTRRERVRA